MPSLLLLRAVRCGVRCADGQSSGLVVVLAGLMDELSRHSVSLWVDFSHGHLSAVNSPSCFHFAHR